MNSYLNLERNKFTPLQAFTLSSVIAWGMADTRVFLDALGSSLACRFDHRHSRVHDMSQDPGL